ncbi:MAG: hypothetical protein WD844_06925 [Thermoleophilaceae bacterium]
MKRYLALSLAAAVLVGAGCGEDDDGGEQAATAAPAEAAAGYTPVSDIEEHAAIGEDVAEIKALLEPAAEGGEADFEQAGEIWSEGRNSEKGDGSARTLAGFAEDSDVAALVEDAITGEGEAAGLDPAQRRQWIDKGMSAALALKVLGELDAAAEKVEAGETDPAEGAPHNVDEAWAFYDAGGEGLATTADKRAADFGLEGEVAEPVLSGFTAAQDAAGAGDAEALAQAREQVRAGLNRIFSLAVKKYLVEGAEDEVAAAEGLAFSWGLQGLPGDARTAIEGGFGEDGDAQAAVDVLDAAAGDLGLDAPVPAYEG